MLPGYPAIGDPVSASEPFQMVGSAEHGDSMGRENKTAGGIHLDFEGLGPEVRPATVEVALGHEFFEPLECLRGSRLQAIGFILHNQPRKKSRSPREASARHVGLSQVGAWGKGIPLPARNLCPKYGCAARPALQDALGAYLPHLSHSLLRGLNDP